MKLFLSRIGKTFFLVIMWIIFAISIIYWKIAKRLNPSKKDEYEGNVTKLLFCGLVPIMWELKKNMERNLAQWTKNVI